MCRACVNVSAVAFVRKRERENVPPQSVLVEHISIFDLSELNGSILNVLVFAFRLVWVCMLVYWWCSRNGIYTDVCHGFNSHTELIRALMFVPQRP